MAGDWIKVEKTTPDKPEIFSIAEALGIDPEVVFTKCFKVWRWADDHTPDGNVYRVSPAVIDNITHTPGFAHALAEVGWLQIRTGVLQFPKFGQHMGQSGKRRALTAKRVEKFKGKVGDKKVTLQALPEKRREEKNTEPPNPLSGGVDWFEKFWEVFPKYRKQKKGKARKAWDAAVKKSSPETIVAAATEYAASPVGKGKYVQGPEPWLNGEGWNDDRVAWQRGDNDGPSVGVLFKTAAEKIAETAAKYLEN